MYIFIFNVQVYRSSIMVYRWGLRAFMISQPMIDTRQEK